LYEFIIPGGTLSTDNALRVNILGDYLNNSGAGRTFTLRVKYGSTTMYVDATASIAVSTLRRPFTWEFVLAADNSASSQLMNATTMLGNVAAATTGVGDLATAPTVVFNVLQGTATENSANDLNFTITIQHSTNNASLSLRRRYACVELISS
jgi:hypothetical protein